MKKRYLHICLGAILLALAGSCQSPPPPPNQPPEPPLEPSSADSSPAGDEVSLKETLLKRRSVRDYADSPLQLDEVSQLVWAAQGVTDDWGGRTAPSAGALYPLEVYVVVGNVVGLETGVYKYQPEANQLNRVGDDDVRGELSAAALGQSWVARGAVVIIITAVYERTTQKYGERGLRYVHMEAGHAAQNLYLQGVALDLGMVAVGAFNDARVKGILALPADEEPLYIIPVGRLKP